MQRNKWKNLIYPIIALLSFLLIWLFVALAYDKRLLLPLPHTVLLETVRLFGKGDFYSAVGGTLCRTLIGFSLSLAAALFFAVLCGVWKPLYRLLSPLVIIARATPTMSIILLSLVWLSATAAPMLIGFLIAFPVLFAANYTAISEVDGQLLEMCAVYKVRRADVVKRLYLPSILPQFFDSAASTLSLTLKVVIAGEVLSQTSDSMGQMMQLAKIQIDTPLLLGWTVAAIVLSYGMELALHGVKKLCVRKVATV